MVDERQADALRRLIDKMIEKEVRTWECTECGSQFFMSFSEAIHVVTSYSNFLCQKCRVGKVEASSTVEVHL
jgi:hypothetical protein